MKTNTVLSKEINNHSRLDAPYYLSEGNTSIRIVNGWLKRGVPHISLNDKSICNIWQPNRNVLAYASDNENYVPYLQPYDILEFFPEERARLSVNRNNIKDLRVEAGTILQTCSGRNLGPLVLADDYLANFVFGSDLIRIDIHDIKIKYYVFAFLNTWVGQALLHFKKTGSVVDHLSTKDVEQLKIPIFDDIVDDVCKMSERAFLELSQARNMIVNSKMKFISQTGIAKRNMPLRNGWTIKSHQLLQSNRIDAAYYDPTVKDVIKGLKESNGVKLHEVAEVSKPAGRYKTIYVDEQNGLPLLSGRQLLQKQIVGLKYMAKHAWADYSKYQLHKGWIAYPADGRVEGRLCTPVVVTASRDGWCASGHIGRLKPKNGITSGYLYLAMAHPAVQAQLSALACGSVVDAIYPEDVENIILPAPFEFPFEDIVEAWNKFDESKKCEQMAMALFNSKLLT